MDSIKNSLAKIQNDVSAFNDILSQKVDLTEFAQQEEYVKTLCEYKDLKELYSKIMPAIKNFEENMITLEKDMETNKAIIK